MDERGRAALLIHLVRLGYQKLYESDGFSNHLHPDPNWGRTLLVPRPEHLAAMKAQAIKENPSRTAKDLADVAALLTLPDIDEAEMRRYFERHGLAARFDELLQQRGPA